MEPGLLLPVLIILIEITSEERFFEMKMKKKPANKKLAAQYGDKTKITRGDIITAAKKNKKKV